MPVPTAVEKQKLAPINQGRAPQVAGPPPLSLQTSGIAKPPSNQLLRKTPQAEIFQARNAGLKGGELVGKNGKYMEDEDVVPDMLHTVLSLMEEKNKLRRDLAALSEYLLQRDHQNKVMTQQLRQVRDENTKLKEKIMRRQREREQDEEDEQGDGQEERSTSTSLTRFIAFRGAEKERI
jgi:hypothetical protein